MMDNVLSLQLLGTSAEGTSCVSATSCVSSYSSQPPTKDPGTSIGKAW
ncbi:MAG TPA: hypothetical protein VGS07_24925 [Thermoanaerobaculia bacterium]|jgi:hypothetical protein|nr:hypothetical protein [Thermoanaerobaculia bacterium]